MASSFGHRIRTGIPHLARGIPIRVSGSGYVGDNLPSEAHIVFFQIFRDIWLPDDVHLGKTDEHASVLFASDQTDFPDVFIGARRLARGGTLRSASIRLRLPQNRGPVVLPLHQQLLNHVFRKTIL